MKSIAPERQNVQLRDRIHGSRNQVPRGTGLPTVPVVHGETGQCALVSDGVNCYYCLMLLKRTSANLGSGVSGGRCGLTTSLNQASC